MLDYFKVSASRQHRRKRLNLWLALWSSFAASLVTLVDCRLDPPETTRKISPEATTVVNGSCNRQFDHGAGIADPELFDVT